MTAGNNGSDTPENDDPFAYLYRAEGDQEGQGGQSGQPGAAPRTGGYGYPGPAQPGVPRTSYNQVRVVGERTYGRQVPNQQQGYGQQAQGQAQGPGYGQQNAHYAAPETLPGGAPRQPGTAPRGGHGGGGRGPNNKGLLIGALAVVAVVIIGIGVAMITNGDDKGNQANPTNQPTSGESVKPTDKPTKPPKKPSDLPSQDASGLSLEGGAATAKDIPGAKSSGGTYVAGFNNQGAAATWDVEVPQAGKYTLFVGFGVPGKDADATLTVNGARQNNSVNLQNFAHAGEGKWEDGWTRTYAYINLEQGKNQVKISCEQGNKCDFALERVWLRSGNVTSG
ncbi:CBM35 domain-containing protein [Streptomyces sp. NPDC005393]|uniref:CBM35 domain-containing protein n=1 Tax=Streptomyces sp. NPDC005393 TaxID=3157041 RepID=UPI00339E298D